MGYAALLKKKPITVKVLEHSDDLLDIDAALHAQEEFGDADMLLVFVELEHTDEVPDDLKVRSSVAGKLITAEVQKSKLAALKKDKRVRNIEISRPLYFAHS